MGNPGLCQQACDRGEFGGAVELLHLGLPGRFGRRAQTLLTPDPASDLNRLHRRWNGLPARRTNGRTRRPRSSTPKDGSAAQLHLTAVGRPFRRPRPAQLSRRHVRQPALVVRAYVVK
ncbi:hypothetical protein AB0I94_22115 [Streptomyces sp. NPDC050147]|uniref:hypothetical protein n=1 Tax=Streptomyces sp. NPDC050147 TaxID=3155513 RepID=UPI0034340F90